MKRPYFKLILGAVFWLGATIILAALMISAATVASTATAWSGSTPFWGALCGTPYPQDDSRGYLDALVFWFFIFAQYIAAIGLFISAIRDNKKDKTDTPEQP